MKYSHYLVPLCLLFSTYCYSQDYQIEDKYRGDPFFRKIDMNKLRKDCTYPPNYRQLSEYEQKKIYDDCPLRSLEFDFTSLHEFIYKEPVVIYNGKDFQLTLSMPVSEWEYKNDVGPEYILEREISLSIINNNIVKDKIYLANNFIDLTLPSDYANNTYSRSDYQNSYISPRGDRFQFQNYTEFSHGEMAYLYYYISPQGDIYTLSLLETDDGIIPQTWKHYQIDTETMKFKLIQIDRGKVKITLPDNFTVYSDPDHTANYKSEEFKKCLKDRTNEGCFDSEIYLYYLDQLKPKMELLAKQQKHKKNNFSLFKQQLDKKCLDELNPFGDDDDLNWYIDTTLYVCEIEGFKEVLSLVEKQLAH